MPALLQRPDVGSHFKRHRNPILIFYTTVTNILLTLLLFTGHFTFGQNTISYTKIILSYSKGHNSWGNPGIYGNSEQIEYTPISDSIIRLTRFFKVSYSAGINGKTFTEDTTELPTSDYAVISSNYIQDWLIQLNTHKENYTEVFVKPRLTKSSKKEIYEAAKSIDKELFFDKDFKEERKAIIEKIQNLYKLDSFLISIKPDIELVSVVYDSWHKLRIDIVNDTDTTLYQCQFWSSLGQPIYRYEIKSSTLKSIINLEANTTAQAFLPKESLIYKILDINNIKARYIKWCLEKYF